MLSHPQACPCASQVLLAAALRDLVMASKPMYISHTFKILLVDLQTCSRLCVVYEMLDFEMHVCNQVQHPNERRQHGRTFTRTHFGVSPCWFGGRTHPPSQEEDPTSILFCLSRRTNMAYLIHHQLLASRCRSRDTARVQEVSLCHRVDTQTNRRGCDAFHRFHISRLGSVFAHWQLLQLSTCLHRTGHLVGTCSSASCTSATRSEQLR